MDEFEIEIDDDLAERIQHWADRDGRTFEEQVVMMIKEALAKAVSKATWDDLKSPPGESPTT